MTDTSSAAPASASAGQASPADHIGRRVAESRRQQGIKASDLARRVGVSTSLISQIERGRSRPSVSTLFSLAEALDVPVDAFFRDVHESGDPPRPRDDGPYSPERPANAETGALATVSSPWTSETSRAPSHRYVVRQRDRATLDIAGGVRWERLTPEALNGVEFLELIYEPRGESNPELYRHPGTEMVVVLEGRLDITVGFETHRLERGDSMYFPSSLPHRYVNPSDDNVARAVTTILRDHG